MKKSIIFIVFTIITIKIFANDVIIPPYESRVEGETIRVPLTGKISFEVPDINLLNSKTGIYENIGLVTFAEDAPEFEYLNDSLYSEPFFNMIKNDGYQILPEHLLKLFDNPDFHILDTYDFNKIISKSYKRINYNSKTIGEAYFDSNSKDIPFLRFSLSFEIKVIINGYLVYIRYYMSTDDSSIIETYPELYKKVDEKEFTWAFPEARDKLYEHLMNDSEESLPECMRITRELYNTILSTLKVPEYDNAKTSSLKNIENGMILKSNDNLRIRKEETTSSGIITTINKGTKVKILKIGKEDNIDGINSNWVQVEIQSGSKDKDGKEIKAGTVGWCYGGYLE